MTRKSRLPNVLRRFMLGTALLIGAVSIAAAQDQAMRRFPQNALRGVITFGEPPVVRLNDDLASLSPGARIRGTNNLLVLSGTLTGVKAAVNYTLDNAGQLKDVWLLRDEETARKPRNGTLTPATRSGPNHEQVRNRQEGVHQDLRLPDERVRLGQDGRRAASGRGL